MVIPVVAILIAGCGATSSPSPSTAPGTSSPSATASAAPSATDPSTTALELTSVSGPLAPGRYTRSGFRPSITIELGEGWFAGTLDNGFFDVQQDQGTPDVIAVQFGLVKSVVGADGAALPAPSATDAAAAIRENPGLDVLGVSDSRMSGLVGTNLEVENAGPRHVGILDVSLGRLGIDPDRRLWISLFDTEAGVLAIMVGGSTAQWDRALRTAEPVLESVVIGGSAATASFVRS
jgi:hypothetical protein